MIAPEAMARIHAAATKDARPWSCAEFAGLLEHSTVFSQGDDRAFALVRVVADEAELLMLATDPAHQRQGHARRLMQAWQSEALARGAERAYLEVAADNHAAIALYSGAGYLRAGLRPGYYARHTGPAADAVIMTRDLTRG